jgi:hypothetical protein
MYVYNHHWNAHKSILLYPQADGQVSIDGNFALNMNDKKHSCMLLFADVIRNKTINKDISKEIITAI